MWYYLVRIKSSDFVRGPLSTNEILIKIAGGEIVENTFVRFGSRSQWRKASDFSELRPYLLLENVPQKRKKTQSANYVIPIVIISIIIFLIILRHNHPSRNILPLENIPLENIDIPQSSVDVIHKPLFSATKEGIIKETNKARSNMGLPPLIENELLNQIAENRITDMFQNQYFSHVSPTGNEYTTIALHLGYPFKRISENLAYMTIYSTDQKFVNLWMQSPGHRRNILDNEVREIGVAVRKGYLKGNDTWIGVQIFGLQSPPIYY